MNDIHSFFIGLFSENPNLDDIFGTLGVLVFFIFSLLNLRSKKESTKDEVAQVETTKIKEVVEPVEELTKAEPVKEQEPVVEQKPQISFTQRLLKGLSKTRTQVWDKVGSILGSGLDDEKLEELEEVLFTSDMSPALVDELIEDLKKHAGKDDVDYKSVIRTFLDSKMSGIQESVNQNLYKFDPSNKSLKVIMIVGVNGAGKTTTIGKLSTKLKAQGAKVVVGACDTFRAAAVEQLEVWCKRAEVEIVKASENADPSGVAFDTVKKAVELEADYCIIDTAGRLHTASNLMDELSKTKKVMSKVVDSAPHETLLVIDAITGQNALRQAQEFNKSLDLSGLIFTKCDGSAKAGSAVSIVSELQVPISYIGVGEQVEDLDIFNLSDYLDALLGFTPES